MSAEMKPGSLDPDKMPPTDRLVMEVLVARRRMGERTWTFSTRIRNVLHRLEGAGLIGYKSGTVEKTCLAWLTDEGWRLFSSPTYKAGPMSGDKSLNLRRPHGDHTLSFNRSDSGRLSITLTADNPLDYGYDEAGMTLDPDSAARLFHWILTGESLPARGPGSFEARGATT